MTDDERHRPADRRGVAARRTSRRRTRPRRSRLGPSQPVPLVDRRDHHRRRDGRPRATWHTASCASCSCRDDGTSSSATSPCSWSAATPATSCGASVSACARSPRTVACSPATSSGCDSSPDGRSSRLRWAGGCSISPCRIWPLILGVAVLLGLAETPGPAVLTVLVVASAVVGRVVGAFSTRRWLLPIVVVGIGRARVRRVVREHRPAVERVGRDDAESVPRRCGDQPVVPARRAARPRSARRTAHRQPGRRDRRRPRPRRPGRRRARPPRRRSERRDDLGADRHRRAARLRRLSQSAG